MQRHEKLLLAIESDFGSNDAAKACTSVVNYIASRHHTVDLVLSFSNLAEILSARSDSEILYTTVSILSNERIAVLKPEMYLLTERGTEPLPDDILEEYFANGELADPISGELIENPTSHLVPVFRASPKWLNEEVTA